MKCASCGANLPVGVDECQHCQTLNDTDFRLLGRARVADAKRPAEEAQCPRCQTPLMSLKIQMGESYPVHRCKRCLGTFFASEDLERLVSSVADDTTLNEARLAQLCREAPREVWPITYIPCPCCRQTMQRKTFGQSSGVICDHCRDHGLWLDGGELGRLLSWARAGGAKRN